MQIHSTRMHFEVWGCNSLVLSAILKPGGANPLYSQPLKNSTDERNHGHEIIQNRNLLILKLEFMIYKMSFAVCVAEVQFFLEICFP